MAREPKGPTRGGRLAVKLHRRVSLIRTEDAILAEELLRQTIGGDVWQTGLHDIALRFIEAVSSALAPDSDEELELFNHLFIQRSTDAEGARSANFAPLINEIRVEAGALQVRRPW